MRISEDCSLCLKDGVCPLQPVVDGQIGQSPRAMFGTAIAFATHVGTVECPHRILTEMQSVEPL